MLLECPAQCGFPANAPAQVVLLVSCVPLAPVFPWPCGTEGTCVSVSSSLSFLLVCVCVCMCQVEDLLAKSEGNKALNDKKRLATSSANLARSR